MAGGHLDDRLAVEHPELVVLDLLGHTLDAAHRALAVVHPEIDIDGDLGPIDEQCHFAMLIGIDLHALRRRIASYRVAVEAALLADCDAPLDLPF
jgi:hypothetical protein